MMSTMNCTGSGTKLIPKCATVEPDRNWAAAKETSGTNSGTNRQWQLVISFLEACV